MSVLHTIQLTGTHQLLETEFINFFTNAICKRNEIQDHLFSMVNEIDINNITIKGNSSLGTKQGNQETEPGHMMARPGMVRGSRSHKNMGLCEKPQLFLFISIHQKKQMYLIVETVVNYMLDQTRPRNSNKRKIRTK